MKHERSRPIIIVLRHAPIKAFASMLLYKRLQSMRTQPWKNVQNFVRICPTLTSRTVPYGLLPNGIYELDNADFFDDNARRRPIAAGAPSLEEYNAQVRNGIRLNDLFICVFFHLLARFHGFHATL